MKFLDRISEKLSNWAQKKIEENIEKQKRDVEESKKHLQQLLERERHRIRYGDPIPFSHKYHCDGHTYYQLSSSFEDSWHFVHDPECEKCKKNRKQEFIQALNECLIEFDIKHNQKSKEDSGPSEVDNREEESNG